MTDAFYFWLAGAFLFAILIWQRRALKLRDNLIRKGTGVINDSLARNVILAQEAKDARFQILKLEQELELMQRFNKEWQEGYRRIELGMLQDRGKS